MSEVPRLRVLHLIDHAIDTGGAERFAMGLIGALDPGQFELWLCTTRSYEEATVAPLRARGVRHLHLGRSSKTDVHRFSRLTRVLRAEHVDVLHAHMFGSNVWGTLLGAASHVPVRIAHEQTWSYEGEPLRRLLDGQLIGRLSTRFIAVSSRDAARMVSIERVPREKVVMIPNAYVPHMASPDLQLRGQLGLAVDAPLVGVVAVLRPQKALTVMLDAMTRITTSVPDAHLVIAGDGECRTELQDHAKRLGLTERTHFLGRRSDVDAILRAVDVAAMSSDYEGTPLVAYECVANRTPLVATDVGGLSDIVQDGHTGRLVPRRDPVALAAAIAELLLDPSERQRLADNATRQMDEFSIATAARRFAELYRTAWRERQARRQLLTG